MKLLIYSLGLLLLFTEAWANEQKFNVVLLTVDDMSADSIGAFGAQVKGTSPNIDKFAKESFRFHYAHVHATSCIPSRNAISSGRYLYNSGVEGFYALPKEQVSFKTIPDVLRKQGYFTIIRGKSKHSYPYHPYPAFDLNYDVILKETKENIRKPESFYRYTKMGIEAAIKAKKPFFFSMDIHDPHTGYYNWDKKESRPGMNKDDVDNAPSKIFTIDEISVPNFLPKTDLVKQEMAAYYSTVRRADDSFGQVIKALKDTGVYDKTIFMFLSDHGMPEPFAKTANYYHSSRTPLIVRWPGVTKNGAIDKQHMIGTIDIFPSILDMLGFDLIKGLDGRSFAPILKGKTQENREYVYTMYEENVGGNRQPTRSVISKDLAYICNLWSDGERKFSTATKGMAAYAEMNRLAKRDKFWKQRLNMLNYRVPQELYNYAKDPDALHNLISKKEYESKLNELRKVMTEFMKQSHDPLLQLFENRDDKKAISTHLDRVSKESEKRRSQVIYSRSGKAKDDKKNKDEKEKASKKDKSAKKANKKSK